jgi:hypothetical protein
MNVQTWQERMPAQMPVGVWNTLHLKHTLQQEEIDSLRVSLSESNQKLEELARMVMNDQTSHDQLLANKKKELLADLIMKAFREWSDEDL